VFLRSRLFLTLAFCLLLSARARAESFSGEVVGITDGDTISVMREGKAVKIRLSGIDCPEKKQAYGDKAKHFASDLAFGKTVTVSYSKKDRYGRILGDVQLPGGKSLNQELLRAGYAWHYTKYSKDRTLAELEEEARQAQRGLWQDRDPIPPWEFRKKR
jgi:micrococcal nuclease